MAEIRREDEDDARLTARRNEMVERQIAARGVKDRRVLAAMLDTPRHLFVEPSLVELAYEDRPLPIGGGQTISQPFMVARATELAEAGPDDRALEVGTGSGYQLAILARLCRQVYGVELLPELADRARAALERLGITNAVVESFDASGGWEAHAPFDVIIVSAGAPRIPPLLVSQLADGGRLVIPVGPADQQDLTVVRRTGEGYETTVDTRCRYVHLLGQYGFGKTPPRA